MGPAPLVKAQVRALPERVRALLHLHVSAGRSGCLDVVIEQTGVDINGCGQYTHMPTGHRLQKLREQAAELSGK